MPTQLLSFSPGTRVRGKFLFALLSLLFACLLGAPPLLAQTEPENTDEECQGMAVVAEFAAASRDAGRTLPEVVQAVEDSVDASPAQHQQLMQIVVGAFSDYDTWSPEEYATLVYRQCGTLNRNVT